MSACDIKKMIIGAVIAFSFGGKLYALDPYQLIAGCQANFDAIEDIQFTLEVITEADGPVPQSENGDSLLIKAKRPDKERSETAGTIRIVNGREMYLKNGDDRPVTIALPDSAGNGLPLKPDVVFRPAEVIGSLHLEIAKTWEENGRQMCRIDVRANESGNILMRYYLEVGSSLTVMIELLDAKEKVYTTYQINEYSETGGLKFPTEVIEETESGKDANVRRWKYSDVSINGGIPEVDFVLE